MVIVLQMGLIKANQKQILKVPRLCLKLRDYGDFQFSLSGELVAE